MKTILATAYAINPYKGSEDGMGWNFILQIARFHRVVAITRENNRAHIERFIEENPNVDVQHVTFLYYDLPYWMRFWKKGSRGAMLYYLLWQFGMVAFIRKQKLEYEIVHNLNFHNDWTPSFLWRLKKPFVWGPIGHHPSIPWAYIAPYGTIAYLKDRITWCVKKYFWHLSPSLRLTVSKANHILCMNKSVPKALTLTKHYSIMPSVATQDFGWDEKAKDLSGFVAISAGRFVPLKGFDLSIRSFATMLKGLPIEKRQQCSLVLVGTGPLKPKLLSLAISLEIESYLRFIEWIDRTELMQLFQKASVFLFPSHEGAGMVVAEALSFGLPLVCLDNEGPGQFINHDCGFAIPKGEYTRTVSLLGKALTVLYENPEQRKLMSLAARKHFENHFHWDRRGEALNKIYEGL